MIYSVTVTNPNGESLELDLLKPELTGIFVYSIEGIGPPKADIHSTDFSTADGSWFNSSRLQERNIVMKIGFLACEAVNYRIENARLLSYRYFPIKQKVTLAFVTENRTLNCEGYVESNEPDIFSSLETASISILCQDPAMYGETDTQKLSGLDDAFEFPFDNNSLVSDKIELGTIVIETCRDIHNDGDNPVGVLVRMHVVNTPGNISLYNRTTKQTARILTASVQAITGTAISALDDIYLNTNIGNRSLTLIRGGTSYNIINALDLSSDWLELTQGENIIAYSCTLGDRTVYIEVDNAVSYYGA